MPVIEIEVEGARRASLVFEEFPQRAHAALLARIADLTEALEEAVVASEPRRTGRLAEETDSSVKDLPERITGRVSITAEFGKAAALEYGAHGTTNVQAHEARLDHVFGKLIPGTTVSVGAHTRRLNIAEHRYLRGPLEAMRDEIIEGLRDALDGVAAAASSED